MSSFGCWFWWVLVLKFLKDWHYLDLSILKQLIWINARVVFPFFSPCIECALDFYPPQINFPLCTIAHTLRLPEQCIKYVKVILWDEKKPFGDESIDGNCPEYLIWIMKRAKEFNIIGVDFRLTQGVVKRIIPAVLQQLQLLLVHVF
uniref:Uncharacterized protein n=1 Tax=Panagrolaimus davidi TaxID=227884 RepID=A0A914NXD4_9BILA